MIEAKVTCLCRQMRINHLGLDLRQGEVGWVEYGKAKASSTLQQYIQKGALQVEYLERSLEMSSYPQYPRNHSVLPKGRANNSSAQRPATNSAAQRPNFAPPSLASSHTSVVSPETHALLTEQLDLQREMLQETRNLRQVFTSLEAVMTALVAQQRDLPAAISSLEDAILFLAAQQKNLPASMLGSVQSLTATMLGQAEAARAAGAVAKESLREVAVGVDQEDEHPVFIPSGLVNTSQAAITVESSSESASADLEDSLTLLRKMKGAAKGGTNE